MQIGPYECSRYLGSGGQAEVWFVRHAGRDLAIKLFDDAVDRSRLRAEIAALRMLQIPGVVRLHEQGEHAGRPYLVMDHVDGAEFPGKGRAGGWATVKPAFLGLLKILSQVHAAGLTHGDLKPANILVDADGQPTLLDFGMARLDFAGAPARGSRDGTTQGFSPPGAETGPQADLYVLGLVLYHALTGDSAPERSFYRRRRLARVPSLPPLVMDLIDALLEIKPARRPASAEHVIELLEEPRLSGLDWPQAALIDDMTAALSGDARCTLGGPPRSGRSWVLRRLAEALTAAGQTVRVVRPVPQPLAALADVCPASDVDSLDALRAVLTDWLRSPEVRSSVFLIDDWTALHPADRAVIEAAALPRSVRVVVGSADFEPMRLGARAAEALFAGPALLYHVPEDAAVELIRRTDGWPGWALAERDAWARGGLGAWEGTRLALTRAVVDRLADGSYASAVGQPLVELRDGAQRATLTAVSLLGHHATLAALKAVDARVGWRVEADLVTLMADGLLRQTRDGIYRPTRSLGPHQVDAPELFEALARILPAESQERRRLLVRLDRWDELIERSIAVARGHLARGRPALASVLLAETWYSLPEAHEAQRRSLLAEWAEAALYEGDDAGFLRVRAALQPEEPLAQLVAAAHTRDKTLGLSVPPTPGFERWRLLVRLHAAWRAGPTSAAWRDAVAIASADAALARDLQLLAGRTAYRERRYDEAASAYLDAAEDAPEPRRSALLLDAGFALTDALRPEQARALGESLQRNARASRNAYYEACGLYLVRFADWQSGGPPTSIAPLIDAMRPFARRSVCLHALMTEAAIRLHAGQPEEAIRWAERAIDAWGPDSPAAPLMSALMLAADPAAGTPDEADALLTWAVACEDADVAVQIMGLVARSGLATPDEADLQARAAQIDSTRWGVRVHVLSVREALAR